MDTTLRSAPRLLPPPESFMNTSHAFIATDATTSDKVDTASSAVFFQPCFEHSLNEKSTAVSATLTTGADYSDYYSDNSAFYSPTPTCSSSPYTRPSSTFYPTPSECSQSFDEQSQYNFSPQVLQQKQQSAWQQWIDELFCEVQAEIQAELQLSYYSRKSSNDSLPSNMDLGLTDACFPISPTSISPSICSQASTNSSCFDSSSLCSKKSIKIAKDRLSRSITTIDKPRAKKYSLNALTQEELAERKKYQNRAAAQRYRSKKSQTIEQERDEIERLERLNAEMRNEQAVLAKQIAELRAQLLP